MAVMELSTRSDADLRVELFVRSLAPETARTSQESVIERLRELEANGPLDAVELYVTGDCVCPSTVAAETETGQFLLQRFEAFCDWAADEGVDLVGFADRCIDSSLRSKTVTGITFPRLCLAVFDQSELLLVAPVSGGDERITVSETVSQFEEFAPETV